MLFFGQRLAVASLLIWLVTAGAWGCLCTSPAQGASGDVHHLPTNPRLKLRGKLRLSIDNRWVDGTGYRPVTIEAIPTPAPSPTERQIRVTLRPMGQSLREVSTLIEIPQGSTSVKKVLLLPQDELWHNTHVQVTEGGSTIEELSAQYLSFSRTNYWSWTEASPAMLFIDSDAPARPVRDSQVAKFKATASDPSPSYDLPDYRNLVRTFPESNFASVWVAADGSQKVGDIDLLSQLNDVARAELLPPAELPDRWLGLTSFDLIFISQDDLERTAKEHPERFEALREWLTAGSVLCVYGVGEKYEQLDKLEKRLKLAPRPISSDEKDAYRGWRVPELAKRNAGLPQTMYSPDVYGSNYAQVLQSQMANLSPADGGSSKKAPETWPFIVREAGLGYVVALNGDNPFPGDPQYWTWMLQTIPNEHWMWFRRHGMSMHRENNDFWNFLIPGVGVAPVVSFLLLITLFAAIIGPVNYIILGRLQRLYLLLITVPLGAAIVTSSLFLYALATDGIGVRARIRSFTQLDSRTGHAISWSRQSYYASIAPSQGLVFPEDAAVYPLLHEPTSASGQRSYGQKLHWDEGQHLHAGYLQSRSAAQFLVVRATPTQARLVVQPRLGGNAPRVTNQLGANIDYLVIADRRAISPKSSADRAVARQSQDDSGEAPNDTPLTYWQVEMLKAGGSAEAKAVAAADVRKRLNKFYRENAPAYPEDYDPMAHSNAMEFLFTDYARYVNVDAGQSPPSTATSVLERQLSRLGRSGDALLEPGTYVAVTESPPQVPLGVERLRQGRSLHVVQGRWGDK